MKQIDWRDMPRLLRRTPEQVDRAGASSMNKSMFVARKLIIDQAQRDLDIKGNASAKLGMKPNKANRRDKPIEAKITTDRGWLHWHLSGDDRRAVSGIRFRGKNYLLIVDDKRFLTRASRGKRRRVKSRFLRRAFIVQSSGGKIVMLYRKGRRGSTSTDLIGVLTPEAKHDILTRPEESVDLALKREAVKEFRRIIKLQGIRP